MTKKIKKEFKFSKTPPNLKIKNMRAISIRQPYAESIITGKKKIEYRSTLTHVRGTVLVYAALGKESDEVFEEFNVDRNKVPKGIIIGTVDIVDCKYLSKDKSFGYILKNPKRFRTFLKSKNQPQPRWFFPFVSLK